MKKMSLVILFVGVMPFLTACNERVLPGTVGRVNTGSGWSEELLYPGLHSCWGRDQIYLVDVTNKTFNEKMNILVGGKVNLRVDFSIRVRANTDNKEQIKKVFESVTAANKQITVDQLYDTFLKMKAQSVPRQVFEIQPDIQTAVANSPALANEVRKQITEMALATPLIVEDAQITNYDWPDSITRAQEDLVKIQLSEAAETAQVRAELKRAEGRLQVEEANKLVEVKKAEAVAESIDIIKAKLAGSPEYLMWHQIRVMGQAAMGPNNCFILYPFATDPGQMRAMLANANLAQMLKPEGPHPELKKDQKPIEQIEN